MKCSARRMMFVALSLLVLCLGTGCDELMPVADAGDDRVVAIQAQVTLDGSKSTGYAPLSYQWELEAPNGSLAVLEGANTINPTFTPDLPGRYTARLVVSIELNNEVLQSEPDEQRITAAAANQCLYRPLPRSNPKARIFCFGYAGQGAQIYDPWLDYLDEDVELVSIMFPGRFNRADEEPFTRLSDVVDEVLHDMAPYTDVPYVIFGHCMGALIGFELADRLEEEGEPLPSHLVMSGTPAAHLPVYTTRPSLHDASDAAIVAFSLMVGLIDLDMAIHMNQHADFFARLRTDFEMVDTWTYTDGMRVNLPMTAMGSANDMAASTEDIIAWQEVTDGPFSHHIFKGKHFFIHSERKAVLAVINDILSGVTAD